MKSAHELNAELMRVLLFDVIEGDANELLRDNKYASACMFIFKCMLFEEEEEKDRVEVPLRDLHSMLDDGVGPVPAYLIPSLCKTTGRYAAVEWICRNAGGRFVLSATPDQDGDEE